MASLRGSRAMIVLLLQLAVVGVVVVSGFHLDLDVDVNPGSRCRQVDLRPCHSAVEGWQQEHRPSQECCRRFQQIQDDECKCEAIVGDRVLGESKYLDKALRLPEECGLSPPRGRECERRQSSDPFLQTEDDSSRRREERKWLKTCYEAVEGGRQTSEECCENLRRIPRERRCEAIREDERLGKERYREESSRLPERCGLPRCDGERRMAFDF